MLANISFRNSDFIMFLVHSLNKIGKHAQENIFLIKIPKILRVFAQDVPYGMKAYI